MNRRLSNNFWDAIFFSKEVKKCKITDKILKSIFELFTIRYTAGSKKKRKYLSFKEKIEISDVYIVCVPTPVKKNSKFLYKSDLSILKDIFGDDVIIKKFEKFVVRTIVLIW